MQNRCVLKFKKQFKLVVINGAWIDEDRREKYKLLFHPSAPNKTNMIGLQMVKKQRFGLQGEHFKLLRSLRYHYYLTKKLTENLKTVLESWGQGLQNTTTEHMT